MLIKMKGTLLLKWLAVFCVLKYNDGERGQEFAIATGFEDYAVSSGPGVVSANPVPTTVDTVYINNGPVRPLSSIAKGREMIACWTSSALLCALLFLLSAYGFTGKHRTPKKKGTEVLKGKARSPEALQLLQVTGTGRTTMVDASCPGGGEQPKECLVYGLKITKTHSSRRTMGPPPAGRRTCVLLLAASLLLDSALSTVVTLSFTVLNQPNIAVGFLDIDPAAPNCFPLQLGELTDETTRPVASVSYVDLVCNASDDSMVLNFNGTTLRFRANTATEWTFNAARTQRGLTWRTKVEMVDLMYDAIFDMQDALLGSLTISAGNTYLETQFGWTPGSSDTATVLAANRALKHASGRCPMLHSGHRRQDDFAYPRLVENSLKRYNWFVQYVHEKQGGVLQGSKDVVNKGVDSRLNYEALPEVVDAMYRDERMDLVTHENARDDTMEQNELRRFQATCLSPFQPVFIKNGNRDMSFVRRSKWEDVAYANVLNGTDPTKLVSAFEGTPKYTRLFFDMTLPHVTGFPQPAMATVVDARNQLEVTSYDIAAVTYEYVVLWWSGKAITGAHADAFAGRWYRLQSVQGGSPNVNGTRMQSNYTEFKEALREVGEHLIPHFESSPVWHYIWPQIKAGEFAASMLNLFAYVPLTAAISIGNVAANAEYLIQRMRFDPTLRPLYRANKAKFIREWLRTRGGLRNTYQYPTTPSTHQAAYSDTKDGTPRTAQIKVSTKYIESRDSVAANLDPSRFSAPNTFDLNRTDWMYTIWGLPLYKYYKDDGTGEQNMAKDASGEFTFEPDYNKWSRSSGNPGRNFGCPGVWLVQSVTEKVVDVFLERIEQEEAADGSMCKDYPLQVTERFGDVPQAAPASSTVCMWALARVDLQFGAGSGCSRLGSSLCCATCADLDQQSADYIHILRSITLMDFKEKQFTWLKPSTFHYYLHTQPFFDANSLAVIPRVSGVTRKYRGAESILEYYTLQVQSFNPSSFRHYKRYYEVADDAFETQSDRLRMKHWHLDPMENNGEQVSEHNVAWTDFSQFVYHNETSFLPFKNIFHDFRPNKGMLQFRPEAWALMNSFGARWEFCQTLQNRCTGNNSQFESVRSCLGFYADMPMHKRGHCPLFAGNTLSCRWMHSILAQDGLRPEVHCYHMGPNKPDPSGNIKCHDSECGKERQGPWDCGINGCKGEFIHAGEVIDWMSVTFWLVALIWAVLGVGLWVRHAKEKHRSTDSQHVLRKISAVGTVFVAVAAIQVVLYLVCATARWQFLWRPPPAISLEPRYSEQRRGQSLFKEVRYTNGYTGQFSEPVLSNMNTYISMHLMFYLLFAGMAMTIIIIEWIGHRFYFGVSKNSIFYNEVPKVGSAVFVIFVSIALITPPSSFSLFIFLLGVTKLGYPDMLQQCWQVWDISIRDRDEEHQVQDSLPQPKLTRRMTTIRNIRTRFANTHTSTVLNLNVAEGLNVSQSNLWFVVHYLGATGLMLHHFMMCTFFAGSMAHVLAYEDFEAYRFSLNVILFLVLFQHLIYQLFNVAGPSTVIFAGIVEVFFQWFVFANLGEASTTLTAVSIFSLALSHWLMMPLAVLHPLIPYRTKASTTTSSTQSPMEEILQRSAA